MEDIRIIISVLLYLIIICLDIVIYGFMSAITRANLVEIAKKAEDGDKISVKLEKLSQDESNTVTDIYIINFVFNCMFGLIVVNNLAHLFKANGYENLIIAAVIIFFTSTFGIVLPGKAVSYNPDKWVYKLYGAANIILKLFIPITFIIKKIADIALLIYGKNPNTDMDNVTEDEIITIVNEGQEQGLIEDTEAEMITNLISFGDKQVADIMTHRMNMNVIDGNATLKELIDIFIEGNNSRYPVFNEDINNIIGIVHIKDAIKEGFNEENMNKRLIDIKGLLYEPEFVPETKNINYLFEYMRTNKIHMAIVVDEYGQTSGLITMEDILEEIVGNILDEHDEEEKLIVKNENNTYEVDGMSLLSDIESELGIELNSEYDTINGFMTGKLGRIPNNDNVGFAVEVFGYVFTVTKVGHRVISSVRITPAENTKDSSTE